MSQPHPDWVVDPDDPRANPSAQRQREEAEEEMARLRAAIEALGGEPPKG